MIWGSSCFVQVPKRLQACSPCCENHQQCPGFAGPTIAFGHVPPLHRASLPHRENHRSCYRYTCSCEPFTKFAERTPPGSAGVSPASLCLCPSLSLPAVLQIAVPRRKSHQPAKGRPNECRCAAAGGPGNLLDTTTSGDTIPPAKKIQELPHQHTRNKTPAKSNTQISQEVRNQK